jgi:hypothetical protein
MATSTKAFVIALISIIVCPFLLFIEMVALMLAAMIVYEPSNPMFIEVISVVVGILAVVGACSSAVMALANFVLIVSNLMVDSEAPTDSPIPLALPPPRAKIQLRRLRHRSKSTKIVVMIADVRTA